MQGDTDRQTWAYPESHLAHAEGHVTEIVQDNVGHAGGQQESCRGTGTVPVPPTRAQAARGRAAWARTPP